jgi:hypothetical protein
VSLRAGLQQGLEETVRTQSFQWLVICIIVVVLMPPINPTPHLYLRVMWIRTLGHVGGGYRCGGDTLMRVTVTCWLARLWSTQAKVDGVVLKAAWHWGSDSRCINIPLGEPGCTPLYVGLLSAWCSVDSDHIFFPPFVGGFLSWGLWEI